MVDLESAPKRSEVATISGKSLPLDIDALKSIGTPEAIAAITVIAKQDKEVVPQAINALNEISGRSPVWAIAEIMKAYPETIPQGMRILKDKVETNDWETKVLVFRVVDEMVAAFAKDEGHVKGKLDLVVAFKETSFPDSQWNGKALLYSVAVNPKGLMEFCREGGEQGIAALRGAFRETSQNLQEAVESVILQAEKPGVETPKPL